MTPTVELYTIATKLPGASFWVVSVGSDKTNKDAAIASAKLNTADGARSQVRNLAGVVVWDSEDHLAKKGEVPE